MAKAPAYQWYPGDFRREPGLRLCSFYARSIWREMLDVMHYGDPYGHFTVAGVPVTPEEFARSIGEPKARVRSALNQLELREVFSRTQDAVIYSRRMVRDEELRASRAAGGRLGGNPTLTGKGGGRLTIEDKPVPTPSVLPSSSLNGIQNTDAVANATGASADVDNSGIVEGEAPHAYLMPILRKHGYEADATDGSILKAILRKHMKISDIEAAVVGLSYLRDGGKLEFMGVQKGQKLSLRMLYALQGNATRPLWREAEEEYYRLQPKQPRPHGMKPLADVLKRVVNE